MPAAREDDDVPDRRDVVRDSLGVGLATGLYGASFGALGVASGLSVVQTCAMSVLIFTGASQFAFVGVLASGGAPLSGALTALLLGSRNALYGLRLAPLLALSRWRRLASAHLVIDESTAMAVTRPTTALARTGFYWTGGRGGDTAPTRGMTRPGRREPSGPRAVLECSVHRDRGFHHGKGSTSQ